MASFLKEVGSDAGRGSSARIEKAFAVTYSAGILARKWGVLPKAWGRLLPALIEVYRSLDGSQGVPCPSALGRIRGYVAQHKAELARMRDVPTPLSRKAFVSAVKREDQGDHLELNLELMGYRISCMLEKMAEARVIILERLNSAYLEKNFDFMSKSEMEEFRSAINREKGVSESEAAGWLKEISQADTSFKLRPIRRKLMAADRVLGREIIYWELSYSWLFKAQMHSARAEYCNYRAKEPREMLSTSLSNRRF
jgi:hypothetical protein